jgi:hypothetical protein
MVAVEEAYIHCSQHSLLLQKHDKDIDGETDNVEKKGGDFSKLSTSSVPGRLAIPSGDPIKLFMDRTALVGWGHDEPGVSAAMPLAVKA